MGGKKLKAKKRSFEREGKKLKEKKRRFEREGQMAGSTQVHNPGFNAWNTIPMQVPWPTVPIWESFPGASCNFRTAELMGRREGAFGNGFCGYGGGGYQNNIGGGLNNGYVRGDGLMNSVTQDGVIVLAREDGLGDRLSGNQFIEPPRVGGVFASPRDGVFASPRDGVIEHRRGDDLTNRGRRDGLLIGSRGLGLNEGGKDELNDIPSADQLIELERMDSIIERARRDGLLDRPVFDSPRDDIIDSQRDDVIEHQRGDVLTNRGKKDGLIVGSRGVGLSDGGKDELLDIPSIDRLIELERIDSVIERGRRDGVIDIPRVDSIMADARGDSLNHVRGHEGLGDNRRVRGNLFENIRMGPLDDYDSVQGCNSNGSYNSLRGGRGGGGFEMMGGTGGGGFETMGGRGGGGFEMVGGRGGGFERVRGRGGGGQGFGVGRGGGTSCFENGAGGSNPFAGRGGGSSNSIPPLLPPEFYNPGFHAPGNQYGPPSNSYNRGQTRDFEERPFNQHSFSAGQIGGVPEETPIEREVRMLQNRKRAEDARLFNPAVPKPVNINTTVEYSMRGRGARKTNDDDSSSSSTTQPADKMGLDICSEAQKSFKDGISGNKKRKVQQNQRPQQNQRLPQQNLKRPYPAFVPRITTAKEGMAAIEKVTDRKNKVAEELERGIADLCVRTNKMHQVSEMGNALVVLAKKVNWMRKKEATTNPPV